MYHTEKGIEVSEVTENDARDTRMVRYDDTEGHGERGYTQNNYTIDQRNTEEK